LVDGLTLRHYLSLRAEDLNSPTSSFSELRRKLLKPGTGTEPWSSEEGISEGPKVFGLSAYAQETPSEDPGFLSGPSSVRALADAADEPDTFDSTDTETPKDLDRPAEVTHEAPPEVDLTELNRPERVGRLKDSMLQLCQALIYIHGHGLVHRDLKPSNVMVDEDRLVRLMDFGLARFLAEDGVVTAAGRLVGTFRYMAPEQILGEQLDSRTDLYSLGVIMYEMLSGRVPFDAHTPYELWQKVLETEALPLSALNPKSDLQLSRIAHRLIRKEPDDRFQTAEEVYEALAE
jgi:eukaryotic-like serine/threonine-protein kinase